MDVSILALSLLLISPSGLASDSEEVYGSMRTNGPWSVGPVLRNGTSDHVIATSDPDIVYRTMYRNSNFGPRLAKSTDGGRTYVGIPQDEPLYHLSVDASNPELLYHAKYRSLNGGETWERMEGLVGNFGKTIPSPTVACGAWHRDSVTGLHRTVDCGDTWLQIELPQGLEAHDIEGITTSADRVAVVTRPFNPRFWISADGGSSWSESAPLPPLDAGNGNTSVWVVAMSPLNANLIFAVGGTAFSGTRLFRSTDGGASWEVLDNFFADLSFFEDRIAFLLSGSILALDRNGVHVSTDNGDSWSLVKATEFPIELGTHPSHSYAHLASGFYSHDQGATWSRSRSEYTDQRITSLIGLGPTHDILVASIAERGLFRSANSGRTWHKVADLAGTLVEHTTDSSIGYLSAGSRLYRTPNSGISWELISKGLPEDRMHILAASDTSMLWAPNAGLRSTDGGLTWYSSPSTSPSPLSWFVNSESNAERVYGVSFPGSLFKSEDFGLTWSSVSTPPLFNYSPLFTSPHDADSIFAVRDDYVLIKSVDAGENWETMSFPALLLAFDPTRPGFIASEGLLQGNGHIGPFISDDAGSTARELQRLMPEIPVQTPLRYGNRFPLLSSSNRLHAPTALGVFSGSIDELYRSGFEVEETLSLR